MRHPFDGVILPDGDEPIGRTPQPDVPDDNPETRSTRRSLLGALAAVFGAAGLLTAGEASASPEYGHRPHPRGHAYGHWRRRVTTQALGEEGGRAYPPGYGHPPSRGRRVTTLAVGEEGGRRDYW